MPPDLVADAKREATEQQQAAEALAERIRNGDQDVTAEQLAAQRQLADFAQLAVTGAERRKAALAAADRDRRATVAADAVKQLLAEDDAQPLLDAVLTARDAMKHLVQLAADRTAAVRAAAHDVVVINEEMRGAGAAGHWPIDRFGVRASDAYPPNVTVLGKGRATPVPPGELAAAVLLLSLGSHPNGRHEAAQMLNGLADAMVKNLGEAVPGLADAWRATPEEWQAAQGTSRTRINEQGRQPVRPEQG